MQPAPRDQQSDASQEAKAAREKTALSGRSSQRERKSPSRSAREEVRRSSSPHRSGSRRSYSPSGLRRDQRRVSEERQPAQRNSHSQDTRPSRQLSSRYGLEGSPRLDRDRRSRDQSSPPPRSAGQSRHRLNQADDRQDQPSARHPPPGETAAEAISSISQKVPATQQSQGQPAPDAAAQQHQVKQDSNPAPARQQPASFYSGLQNIKQVADGSVPGNQAAPAMSSPLHSPSTAAPPPPPSRPHQPPAGLLGVASGVNRVKQEACSSFHDPSQGLPTVTSVPSVGSPTHTTAAASLSPPLSLPGPPARQLGPPSLRNPAVRQPPTSGQGRPSTSLPSLAQLTSNPEDPALDFFSESFDALRALYTRGLLPPVPRVKVLDNVVKCRLILPPELPESWSAWNAAHPKAEPSEVSHLQHLHPFTSPMLW